MVDERDSRNGMPGGLLNLLALLVAVCWALAGLAIGGVVCVGIEFCTAMAFVLDDSETRVVIDGWVYVAVLVAGMAAGLVAFVLFLPGSASKSQRHS